MDDINALKRKRLALLQRARAIVGGGDESDASEAEGLIFQADALENRVNELEGSSWRARTGRGITERMGAYQSTGPKTGRPVPDGRYSNMDDFKDFSIVRAIRAMVNNDWRDAEKEREASDQVAKELGRQSRGGFFIPEAAWLPSRQEQRDLLKATGSAGGYLVAEDLLGGSFVDRLAAASAMLSAGVIPINDLVGDVTIPRLATGATAYWVAENVAATESAQTFEQITLSPHSVAAFTDISRRLILQSSVGVEELVRSDIMRSLATAIDKAILQGTGTDQPTGVKGITGVTDKSGANGEAITWAEILDLEAGVATANAALGRLAYITNSTIQNKMKQTLKVSGGTAPPFIWEGGANPVNDHPCFITNQIAHDLTKGSGTALSLIFFGNWQDVVLGRWSGIDVLVDPYTGGTAGTVRIIAFADVDVAVRHPESFTYGYYS
jgi:HK97 family phage major capsid protein